MMNDATVVGAAAMGSLPRAAYAQAGLSNWFCPSSVRCRRLSLKKIENLFLGGFIGNT